MLKAALRVLATATLATAALAPTAASASPHPDPGPRTRPGRRRGSRPRHRALRPVRRVPRLGLVAYDDQPAHRGHRPPDRGLRALAVAPRHQHAVAGRHPRERDGPVRAGFAPRGDAMIPLAEYIVKGGGQNSAHVSTTCEKWVAQKFATYGAAKTGWVYEIDAPGGIDVNATAALNRYESPYLWNKEIDFPGGIEGRYIKQACKFHLTKTDPQTKVNTYENLGCKTNERFRPERPAGLEMPAQR